MSPLEPRSDRILVISYFFPPYLTAEGIQVGKYVKYMLDFGYAVDVVTSEAPATLEKGKDNALFTALGLERASVIRIPGRARHPISKIVSALTLLPNYSWCFSSRDIVLRLLDLNLYKYIFSFSWPFESHLLALMTHNRARKVPWVVHISDPWVGNPYISFNFARKATAKVLEASIIHTADYVIFVSKELRDFVMSRYPSSRTKSMVVPHFFVEDLYPENRNNSKVKRDSSVLFTYVGGFSHARNPEPLLKALAILKHQNKSILDRIRIRFVGPEMERYRIAFDQVATGIVEAIGPVPYLKSLEEMCRADYLLVFDANFSCSPFLPSKLVDYLGSGRPIIGITPNSSCSHRVLRELGYHAVAPDDSEGLAMLLIQLIKNNSYTLRFHQEYSGDVIMKRLFVELDER